MPDFWIRKAAEMDIAAMAGLLKMLFSIEHDFTPDPLRQRLGLQMLLGDERAHVLVAEIHSRIIGMCSGQLLISTAKGGFSLQVEDVVVEDAWQDRGVGTVLLQGLEAWAVRNKVQRLQLAADMTNYRALAFYRRRNWCRTRLLCLHKEM